MSDTKSLRLANKKRGLLWPIVIATVFASGFIIYGYIKSNALNERHAEYNHQVRNTASSESLVSAFSEAFEICVEANYSEQTAVCQKFDSFIAGQLATQDLMVPQCLCGTLHCQVKS